MVWINYFIIITCSHYNHLPPISKVIKLRRTRNAGHSRRSKDELISDVLLWSPTNGRANVGRPTRTYLNELCVDKGCIEEDLLVAMDDRDGLGERERERERERWRVREICAVNWWWWWWWLYGFNHQIIIL